MKFWGLAHGLLYVVGLRADSAMTGQTYADIKLSRKDQVAMISSERNKISVRSIVVEVLYIYSSWYYLQ